MQNSVPDWIQIAQPITEITLALVAIVISIIALFQTKKQTKLSNKQFLFERRLERYTIIEDFLIQVECINSLNIDFSSKDEIEACDRIILKTLCDCILLREARGTIDKLNDITDYDAKYMFLTQCNKLSILSKEIPIIFRNEKAKKVSEFVEQYAILILSVYHYYTLTDTEKKEQDSWIEIICKKWNELKATYNIIIENNIMNLLLTETKL